MFALDFVTHGRTCVTFRPLLLRGAPDSIDRCVISVPKASKSINRKGSAKIDWAYKPTGITLAQGTKLIWRRVLARDGLDRRAIAKFAENLQREFNKHPVIIPVEADGRAISTGDVTYNGPVIHGNADGAQMAWNNETVNQQYNRSDLIAPGFESIAEAVADTLANLGSAGLSDEDQQDAEAAAREVLEEVTEQEPDRGKIRRALSVLKGLLAPVATGVIVGASDGGQEWARSAIEQLGTPF